VAVLIARRFERDGGRSVVRCIRWRFGIFLEELLVSVEDSAAMVSLWILYKDKEGMCVRWEVFVTKEILRSAKYLI
jgi:hypothetical protein